MKTSGKILYLYFGVDGVVILFKVLHHIRRRFAFRNQLSEAEFTDRRSVFHEVPLCRFTISKMLPQFGIVLAARWMEVSRLGKIFKRLTRNRTLRSEIMVFIFFELWEFLTDQTEKTSALTRTYPDLVVDGAVVILQMFEHVCSASSLGSHFLLAQFADGEVIAHHRAVCVF